MRKIVSGLIVMLLLTSTLTLVFSVQELGVDATSPNWEEKHASVSSPSPQINKVKATPADGSGRPVEIAEHKITALELDKLKQQVGVSRKDSVDVELIKGHGTGLCTPTEEVWAEIAENTQIVEKVSFVNTDQLASTVDHSTSPCFPPIGDQDGQGSCVTWAVGYYVKTFQEAEEHSWNLTNARWEGAYPTPGYQDKIISPAFIYNLVHREGDSGTFFDYVINLVCSVGACSWAKMPYDASDYATWPSESAWREAAYYRGASTGCEVIVPGSADGILSLKNLIASGNLAVIGVNAYGYSNLTDNDVWTLDTYTNIGENHANTIVGYDDNFSYLEGGQLCKGAFKIANSWGVGGWERIPDGFYWISYQAMSQRIRWIWFYRDRIGYVPTLTSSFRIGHPMRQECNIVVGMGTHDNPSVSKCFNDWIYGGYLPFCANNIVFDITEFKDVAPTVRDQPFFMKVYDGGTSATGTILYFAIESSVRTASSDPPKATVDRDYVFADIPFLNDPDVKLAWTGSKVVSGTPEDDVHPAMAIDNNGSLYTAFEHHNPVSGFFEIHVSQSTDHGSTWSEIQSAVDNHNLRYPSIAIDVGDNNNIFVAFEREWISNDHDIFVLRYVSGSWSIASVANVAGNDDRYPSITCEYQYGASDRLYISYEYVYTFDDRDLMFAKSVDDGASWSLQKIHGGWPDYNVHCQTSIANARGSDGNDWIYIAYKWGADYNTAYDIVIDKSKDRGSTWTQAWVCDESARDKNWPSIAATHGTGTVVIAWHVYCDATYLNDVQYASSTNNGNSWYVSWLTSEDNASEENLVLTVDGQGSTSTIVYGYVHAVYWKDGKICYKKASFDSPWLWTEAETATDPTATVPAAYNKPAITTYKYPDGQYLPVVAWTDVRNQSCDIYCSRAAIQRNLTVVSAHGNPNPPVGDHLYFDGDSVTCNVSSPVTENGAVWTCNGWNGTGFVPSSGNTSSVTFTITENSSITWNWQGQPYSPAYAHVRIEHPNRTDLNVTIGVGNPSNPSWSKVLWKNQGSGVNIDLTVDVSEAAQYLPPSETNRWFLKVVDNYPSVSEGKLAEFSISYKDQNYTSPDVPLLTYNLHPIYAFIPSTATARVIIEHTFRGDLIIDLGAGNPASPNWTRRIWDGTKEGGSLDNLDLKVDLADAKAYLPPTASIRWFLKVYDRAAGDTGRITAFNITYGGTAYSSTDVPVPINDLTTSYAYIPQLSSPPSAKIYIEHTWVGDLNITLGCGNPSSPLWSKLVWNRAGGSQKNLSLTVDLSSAVAYLPPSNTYGWYLKVYDAAAGDTGRIVTFNITFQGKTYSSTNVPVSIKDFVTSYAYIPSLSPPQAHIYIQHTYRGDLIVDIGVGSTSTPLWSKRVWNGTGGGLDNLDLYVDLSSVVKYLPPSATYTWWVKVYDRAAGDTGKIVTFTITYQGNIYTSPNVPVPIGDLKTSYAYIKG